MDKIVGCSNFNLQLSMALSIFLFYKWQLLKLFFVIQTEANALHLSDQNNSYLLSFNIDKTGGYINFHLQASMVLIFFCLIVIYCYL